MAGHASHVRGSVRSHRGREKERWKKQRERRMTGGATPGEPVSFAGSDVGCRAGGLGPCREREKDSAISFLF